MPLSAAGEPTVAAAKRGHGVYVQPRTRNSSNSIGIGIPRAHSKIQPIAPSWFFKCFMFSSLPAINRTDTINVMIRGDRKPYASASGKGNSDKHMELNVR